MRRKKRWQSGITMIALVVTIATAAVVTGVVIKTITGGESTFEKSTKAVSETKKAEVKECVYSNMTELKMNYFQQLAAGKRNLSFNEYIKQICAENGGEYQLGQNQKIILEDDILWYENGDGDKAQIVIDNSGAVTVKSIETANGEIVDYTTEDTLNNEVEDVLENLKKEYDNEEGENPTKTFEEYIKEKINESDEGYLELENGGKLSERSDGKLLYTDTSKTTNTAIIAFDSDGNTIIENLNVNNESMESIHPTIELNEANITFDYNISGVNISSTTWTNENITVTAVPQINTDGYIIQTSLNGVKWNNTASQTLSENGNVYVRLWNGTKAGEIATASIGTIEKTKPEVIVTQSTTNSIIFNASDTQGNNENISGVAAYIIQKNDEEPELSSSEWIRYDGSSITVEGLTQGTTYYVFVKDRAGNISDAVSKSTETIAGLENGNVQFQYYVDSTEITSTTDTNQSVTVKATTQEAGNLTLRLTTSDPTKATKAQALKWVTGSTGVTFEKNGTVYAVLVDNEGQIGGAASANVETIDKTNPVARITKTTTNSITFSGKDMPGTSEKASGVNAYMITTSSTKPSATAEGWTSYDGREITVGRLNQGTTYYVYVRDNAGNVSEAASQGTGSVISTASSNVTIEHVSWNGATATVRVSTTEVGVYVKYKVGTSGDWIIATSGSTTTVSSGTTVYAYLCDSSGQTNGSPVSNSFILTCTVTCKDYFVNSSNEGKVLLGTSTKTYNYGQTAYGSDWGSSTERSAYYSYYAYSGCSQASVGVNGATVYRYFKAWTNINALNPNGGEDYASLKFSVSYDSGNTWVTNQTNEQTYYLYYGTNICIKDVTPYYSYYYFKDTSNLTWNGSYYYYTVTSSGGAIQLYAGYNSYYLDLNGTLDGAGTSNISGYGTADVYINGTLVSSKCSDFYQQIQYGSTYKIVVTATQGHLITGQSVFEGTITGYLSVYPTIITNQPVVIYDNGTRYYPYSLNFGEGYYAQFYSSYIWLGCRENKTLFFTQTFENKYRYLKIIAQSSNNSTYGPYNVSCFFISSSMALLSYGAPRDVIREYAVANGSSSPNITNWTEFTLDLSSVSNSSYYVGVRNCDSDFYIQKIWLTN